MNFTPDMADVRNDALIDQVIDAVDAKQNILLVGPSGIGKTMIARRIPGILPVLTDAQREMLGRSYRSCRILAEDAEFGPTPPFRAPHHTVSTLALVGGHRNRSGEIDLARCGVLMIDELREFRVSSIGALSSELKRSREPGPMIVATANPCPCGWNGVPRPLRASWKCDCSAILIERYQKNVAHVALMLGIGTVITVPLVTVAELRKEKAYRGRTTAEIRKDLYGAE